MLITKSGMATDGTLLHGTHSSVPRGCGPYVARPMPTQFGNAEEGAVTTEAGMVTDCRLGLK